MPFAKQGVEWALGRLFETGEPASFWVALLTERPDFEDDGTDIEAFEPGAATGYERIQINNNEASWYYPNSTTVANNVIVPFPEVLVKYPLIRYPALVTASSGGELVAYGRLPHVRQPQVGSIPRFLVGQIRFSMIEEEAIFVEE